MADKVSALSLSDLITDGYGDAVAAREQQSSPTARLERERQILVNTFKNQKAQQPVLPEAGSTRGGEALPEPGSEAPAAPKREPGIYAAPEGTPAGAGQPVVEKPQPIMPSLGEALKAGLGGALLGVKRSVESVRDLAAMLLAGGQEESAQEIEDVHGVSPDQARREAKDTDPLGRIFVGATGKAAGLVPQTGEPESVVGKMEKELVAFLTPFVPIAKSVRGMDSIQRLLKGGNVSKAIGTAVEGAIAGVPASILALDPASPRFANLVNSLVPEYKNPVTEFLAAPELKEGEELALEKRFTERMKNAGEGLLTGVALDALLGTVIAARRALIARNAGRRFKKAVETATAAHRAGERNVTVEEAAGPLAHNQRPVTMPGSAAREMPGPSAEVQAADVPGATGDVVEATLHEQMMDRRLGAASQVIKELHDGSVLSNEGVSGGSTFNLRHGDLGGQDAYAVAFAPDLSESIPGASPTIKQFRAFIDKVRQAGIDVDDERISIGSWFDKSTGQTVLDVVATPRDQETAIAWGKAFNQKAIFDLKNFQEIDTGGTGLVLENLPPLSERLATILGPNQNRSFPQSVLSRTEQDAEGARMGLWQAFKRIVRDETGAILLGGKGGLKKDELNRLGMIGAAALMRGRTAPDAFRDAIEGAFSVGGRLSIAQDDLDRIFAESQKIVDRNVRSALREAEALAKELGEENAFHGMPSTARLLDLYEQGKFGLDWYDGAYEELKRIFGKDADLVADLIGVTSARTRVDRNVYEAIEAYIAIKQGKTVDEMAGFLAGPAARFKRDGISQVLKGIPINTPKVGPFTRNIKGDPNAVTIDSWMARIFYGRDGVKEQQSVFLQEWVRQLAYDVGIQPRQMQAAIWIGKRMEDEFKFMDDPDFAPLRDVIRDAAQQAFNEGRLQIPKADQNEAGFIRWGTMWFLSRVAAGALYGASGKNQTMEERIENALVWGGVAGVGNPATVGKLVRGLSKILTEEKARVRPRIPGKSSAAQGIASEPIKPEATTFTTLAEEYAERVRIATRGEVLDEESGFVKVRPRESQFKDAVIERARMDSNTIRDLMPTIKMSDAEAIAMAQVMNEQGLKLRALAVAAKDSGFQDATVREFLKQLYLFGRMDPNRLGALAEAGRTLGALNDPVSGMNAFLDQFTEVFKNAKGTVTPQRMIEAISKFRTPEELALFARQISKPGFKDYFFEVWINGLLSGPKTWVVNGLSNSTTLLYSIGERGMASAISAGVDGSVAPDEAKAMLAGIVEAHGDALKAFWRALSGQVSPGASKLEMPENVITAANLDATGVAGRAVDLLGSAIRTPGRVIQATDEYFKGIATRAELRAQAKREAFHEVRRLGLEGEEAVKKMHEIEQAFLADPPVRAMQKANKFAAYVTFTSELGETGQALQQLQKTAIGRIILPFVRTPVNIFKFAGERTGPLGLASARLREELRSADPAVREIAKAKIALSSMTIAFFASMAANGYITGGGPSDPVLLKQFRDAGWQPYSFWFDVNGNGKYDAGELVSYARGFEPLSMIVGMTADATNIMGHLSQAEADDLGAMLVVAFSKNFTSKTFVRGVAQTVNTMANPEEMSGRQISEFVGSLLPFSSMLRQGAMALDPEMRDAQGLIENLKKRIPGLSPDVPPDTDLFGNSRFLGGGLGSDLVPSTFKPAVDFVMPIYVNSAPKEHQDIFRTLMDNDVRAPEAPESIDGIRLSSQERYDLKRIAGGKPMKIDGRTTTLQRGGKTMPEALRDLFASPAWKVAKPGRGGGRDALAGLVIRGYFVDAAKLVQEMDSHKDLKTSVLRARIERARQMGVPQEQLDAVRNQLGVE